MRTDIVSRNEFAENEIEAFQTHLELKGLSKITQEQYIRFLKRFLGYIEEYGMDEDAVNRIMLKHNHGVFRAFLKSYAEFRDIDIKIPKQSGRVARKVRKYLPPDHVEKIGNIMFDEYHPRYYLMLFLSYFCGLRRKECISINVDDFDFKEWLNEGRINNCSLKISVEGAKGKKERIVFVNPDLAKHIYNHIITNQDKVAKHNGNVFYTGKRMWNKVFLKCTKKAELPYYTLHDLRRGIASYWYKEGMDLLTIKNRLGHSDLSTTQKYIVDNDDYLEKWKKE